MAQKLTVRMACAISPRDLKRVAEMAARLGTTQSQYIRSAIRQRLERDLGVSLPPPRPTVKARHYDRQTEPAAA